MPETLKSEDMKKGQYLREKDGRKREGYITGKKVTDPESVEIVFASQVAQAVKKSEFAKYEKSGAFKYYLAGPGWETVANCASYFVMKKAGKALLKQSDFNMAGMRAFFIDEMVYEVGLKMYAGARPSTKGTEEGDADMWQTMIRPFGQNLDTDKGKKEDWLTTADAWDAVNKVPAMFIIDKAVRALMNKEKLASVNVARYVNYFVAFYLANIVQRKMLGTKDSAEGYTHY